MIFALILHHNGADLMKLGILAAFHTNSRRLIRIWRSWGLVGSKKRKQGAERVVASVRKICKKYENRKKVGTWVGRGRGSSRLVQNDQRNCRNVFKQVWQIIHGQNKERPEVPAGGG